jgi:phosphinothricin acetyltransferase
MANRIRALVGRFPWLVLDADGIVAGYVYASPHRERAAYGWSVDVAAYVAPTHRRSGVGRALYTTLFHVLPLQGYYKAYAGITLPNPASVGLHEAMGFELVGVYRGVGYKLGAWHDVAWYGLALQPERLDPGPPPAGLQLSRLPALVGGSRAGPGPLSGSGSLRSPDVRRAGPGAGAAGPGSAG